MVKFKLSKHTATKGLILLLTIAVVGTIGYNVAQFSQAATPTDPVATMPASERFGMAAGCCSVFNTSDIPARLDDLKSMGVKWVRIDVSWAEVQGGGPSSWNWSRYDTFMDLANARGINVLGILAYSPAWARPAGCGDDKCGPANPADYATFARAAATRYAPKGVHHWEIWNEQNLNVFWHPRPDAAAYTRMLKLAYPAIKQADPAALVVSGGFAPAPSDGNNIAPRDFLQAMYTNGAQSYFDALGHHPYCFDAAGCPDITADWSAWYQMYGTASSLRSQMVANGDSAKKIWATEFGAPTTGSGAVSEAGQAAMVSKAFQMWNSYDWAGPLFWYSYRDVCTNTVDRECSFGLKRYDGAPKPAYNTWKSVVAATPVTPPAPGPNPVPVGIPDLVVTSVAATPAIPAPGQAVTFKATIKNQGTGNTPIGTVHGVAFGINGSVVSWSDTHTTTLAPGASVTLTANAGPDGDAVWMAGPAANYQLTATVDDINRISGESNETNNQLGAGLVVTASAPPTTPGDINGDGRVNALDISIIIAHDGQAYQPADLNNDGTVGAADMSILLARWTW